MINIQKNELNYLLGYSVQMDSAPFEIRQIKFKEFESIDYEDFAMVSSLLALPKTFLTRLVNPEDDRKTLELSAELETKTSLEVLKSVCMILSDMPDKIVSILNLHTDVEVIFDASVCDFAFITNEEMIVLDEIVYGELKDILQDINQLSTTKDQKNDYKSDYDYLIKIQRLADEAKELAERNNSKDNVQTFPSIVSTVATLSPSIDLIKIKELTLYQIYEQYHKMIVKDSYDTAMLFAPHTGEVSNVEHWSKTIHKKEEHT